MKLNRENHNVSVPLSEYNALVEYFEKPNIEKELYDLAMSLTITYFVSKVGRSIHEITSLDGLFAYFKENNLEMTLKSIPREKSYSHIHIEIASLKYINEPKRD